MTSNKAEAKKPAISPTCAICHGHGDFVPDIEYLDWKLGRSVLPEELVKYVFCERHQKGMQTAEKHRSGRTIKFLSYEEAFEECERLHTQLAQKESEEEAEHRALMEERKRREEEEKRQAEEARQQFEDSLQGYLGRFKMGAMAHFKSHDDFLEEVCCSFGNCGHYGRHDVMFVPSVSIMKGALGRDVLLTDLEAFALCSDHLRAIEKRDGSVEFHKIVASIVLIKRIQEQRERADQRAAQIQKYLDEIKPGAMLNFKGNGLPKIIPCVLSICGYKGEHNQMFVPSLQVLNKTLGRDVLPEDLPRFALCLKDKRLVEKRGIEFHRLSASIEVIERNRKERETLREEREAEREAKDYLDGLFPAGEKPAEEKRPENVVELRAGVKCTGKKGRCENIIPVDKHTTVCDECRHPCKGGCGRRIPDWFDFCRECAAAAKSGETRTARKKRDKRKRQEKEAQDEAARRAKAEAKRKKAEALDVRRRAIATRLGIDFTKAKTKEQEAIEMQLKAELRKEEEKARQVEEARVWMSLSYEDKLERAAKAEGLDLLNSEEFELAEVYIEEQNEKAERLFSEATDSN